MDEQTTEFMSIEEADLHEAVVGVTNIAAEDAETLEDRQDKFWRMNAARARFRKASKALDAAAKAATKVSP